MAPRIGVTWPRKARATPDRYTTAIEAAGGIPVLVTPAAGARAVDDLDGLLLAGGLDVHPRHYGRDLEALAPDVRRTVEVDEERDALELDVIRRAVDRGMPILGICRGVQVLNVALGGTLIEDLSLVGIARARHYQRGRLEDWESAHEVRLEAGSTLGSLFDGQARLSVNSFHHQVVGETAPGLRVAARSDDGLVEALDGPGHRFLLGVQWHPERMVRHVRSQRRLFAALVEAATDPHRA